MMRLDKLLATLDVGTRSQVQKIVRSGAVRVDGNPIKDPGKNIDEKTAEITVGGQKLDTRLTRHLMLHKPAGLLTAARDKKQPTVMDLVPSVCSSIGCMPVGRLDKDTTGLLLLTTDGELNHRLLAPGRHVDKTYYAEVDGQLDENSVKAFAEGLDLGDFEASPAALQIIYSEGGRAAARVTIHEGRFHQVKRMFEAVGCMVTRLHRETFGPLNLENDPALGEWRELTDEEVRSLYQAAGMETI